MKKALSILLILLLSLSLISCSRISKFYLETPHEIDNMKEDSKEDIKEYSKSEVVNDLAKDGYYISKEDVSLYIHIYNKLPNNYITKKEANNLGWESSKGNLWDVTVKMSIGGDKFGNREKILPTKAGRTYYECDINYKGGFRGPERLVYSNDGQIYYTQDHYETFNLLYGDE